MCATLKYLVHLLQRCLVNSVYLLGARLPQLLEDFPSYPSDSHPLEEQTDEQKFDILGSCAGFVW